MTIAENLLRLALSLFARPSRAEPEGVLLVTARGPADMVFLSAVLPRFMTAARPGEHVTLLLRPDAAGMGFLFPRTLGLKRVDFTRLGNWALRWPLLRELHATRYRLVVALDAVRDPLVDLLVLAANAPMSAAMERGVAPDRIRAIYTELVDAGPLHQDKVLRWSNFIAALTHPIDTRPALALVTGIKLPEPERLPPTAILMPFSAVRRRQCPPALWQRVIDALPAKWDKRIAGHPADFDANPAFRELLARPDVSPETHDFERLAAILRGARLVVGVDTAPLHLAALLGVPTLCLASSAYVGAGVPYDEAVAPSNIRFIHTPMDCQGCMGHCSLKPVDGMLPCVAAIDADAVAGVVADTVARGTP